MTPPTIPPTIVPVLTDDLAIVSVSILLLLSGTSDVLDAAFEVVNVAVFSVGPVLATAAEEAGVVGIDSAAALTVIVDIEPGAVVTDTEAAGVFARLTVLPDNIRQPNEVHDKETEELESGSMSVAQ